MLDVVDLGSRYGRIPALRGVALRVEPGELVALVGANGAGKTTLLRAISGVQPVCAGMVRFDGKDLARLTARQRVQMGIVQVPEGRQVFGPLSVEDNLLLGAFARGSRNSLDPVLAMFPALQKKRHQPAGTLSGGQQQMLAIARALMTNPKVMLVDEPSLGLAPKVVDEVYDRLCQLQALRGLTLVIVEQSSARAARVGGRMLLMRGGRIVADGDATEFAARDLLTEAYFGGAA